jgi:membrane fusion protein (multidrug efflux system)
MTTTFSRTLRSLEADRPRRRVAALLLVVLPIAWSAWFLGGRVTIYEVTGQARLEVQSAAHPVAAAVGGRVVETNLAVGRAVRAGDPLVRLDDEAQRLVIGEARARRDGLVARREALQREIQAEQEGLPAQREARVAALEEARSLAAEAEARARLAQRQADRTAALRARGAASEDESQRDRAEAEAARAAARALDQAATRRERDRAVEEIDRKARLAGLERQAAELQGDVAAEEAALRRLDYDLDQRTVRAPVSGRVGEMAAEVRVGSVVGPAQRLGAIVPPGRPRAVALFPAAAVGRVRPGQPVRLRLDGFAWTQYGTIPAVVAEVADEASAGRIRVELDLEPARAPRVPLRHGLPGSAEVAIERVSPAVLVLRAAGQLMSPRRASAAASTDRGTP